MTLDLHALQDEHRLLFAIELSPLQGHRFQPTGFPGLGAATFRSPQGECLLVESAQSMANRLELTLWDEGAQKPKEMFSALSHVRVERKGDFLTDSILEPHRVNSPYIEKSAPKTVGEPQFHKALKEAIFHGDGPLLDRKALAQALFKYDIGSLIHGVFLESIDGRIRIARALSAFIEADGVQVAASGGVKNDAVNPSGDAKSGFGNVPFARDEFTAERITLYASIDLAQIRGYGLGRDKESLLTLLCLYKLRALIDGGLRLRTACDLRVSAPTLTATSPEGFALPPQGAIEAALQEALETNAQGMVQTIAVFDKPLSKPKKEKNAKESDQTPDDEATE